jgi:putative membrane protein
MFYIVRLFIYNAEANEKPEPERTILQQQFGIMIRRLWYGITWPSAVLTLVFGPWMWYMLGRLDRWLVIKLGFVIGLYLYHFSLHAIFKQQMGGRFLYSSGKLRVWNEVATVFLVAIVMLVTVKHGISLLWGLGGLVLLVVLLMSAIKLYKSIRAKKQQ